jgi:D-alanyl-D-alanine carboxypeptidase
MVKQLRMRFPIAWNVMGTSPRTSCAKHFLWFLGLWLGCACRHASATDHLTSASATASASETATAHSTASETATTALSLPPSPAHAPFPYGSPSAVERYTCPAILGGGEFRAFLAGGDTHVSFIDGDNLLALVNRSPTGALSPMYAPVDLVDLRDERPRSPSECESTHPCLRREAARALHRMLDDMRGEGLKGVVQSSFRGFGTQCWVFAAWARHARAGFCEAAEQSALPGHSQHQLGTTVDLFTTDWAEAGVKNGQGVFRNGFGCTRGGKWLDENAWRYGFVVPYPINPEDRKDGSRCAARADRAVPIDPQTGYKHEPWHLRFVGVDASERYHQAWQASGPGTPGEVTLEQWLRTEQGLVGDAELPVCDGCSCGACSTLAGQGEKAPCGDASLRLAANGEVSAPADPPQLVDARVAGEQDDAVILEVTVHAPAHTPTQTPITSSAGPTFAEAETFSALAVYAPGVPHRYPDLPGAWRIGIEPKPAGPTRWPWRASLARAELADTWNRANIVLPAKAGLATVRMRIALPSGTHALRTTLLRDGEEHESRELSLP